MDTPTILIIVFSILVALIGGGYFAYSQGLFDPIIEKITIYIAKRKAAEEGKKLGGEGIKAGTEALKGELGGNKEAAAAVDKLGGALGGALSKS